MLTIEEALEGSTPLAKKVAALGPVESPAQLLNRMRAALPGLTEEEAIATLNAHPRIGERPEAMSDRSRSEQGTDSLPELDLLNAAYEHRFGFRFVVFVNRRSKTEIVDILRQRLLRSRPEELSAGLEAIIAIAEDRLRS